MAFPRLTESPFDRHRCGYGDAMATSDSIIKLRELVGDVTVTMLTTENQAGELHSRPLTLGEIDDSGTLAFLVDRRAGWVSGLRADDQVNISIANEADKVWVSIAGSARISEERAAIHRLWGPNLAPYFPDGVDSPDLRLLSVSASSAEYWDAPSSRVARLAVKAGSLFGRTSKAGDSGSIELD